MAKKGIVAAKRKLLERFGPVCKGCDREFDSADLTVDHIRPLAHDGHPRSVLNLQLMCEPCNHAKGSSWDGVSGLWRGRSGQELPEKEPAR
jgi:5-methylcytosine-specific restriction endonuclease McrA